MQRLDLHKALIDVTRLAEEIKKQYFPNLRAILVVVGSSTEEGFRGVYDPSIGENGQITISATWLMENPTKKALANTLKHELVHAELYFEQDKLHHRHDGRWIERMYEVGASESHTAGAYLFSVVQVKLKNKEVLDYEVFQKAIGRLIALQKADEKD